MEGLPAWRACPPLFLPTVILAGLPAVFLVRRLCGGVAGLPADHLMAHHLQEGVFKV